MNDPSDSERLFSDVFSDLDDFRAASLAHGLGEMRRARRRRRLTRLLTGAGAVVLTVGWLTGKFGQRPPLEVQAVPAAQTAAASTSGIKILTDDELLDQFPGRAVALIGGPEHRRLVFLDVGTQPPARRAE
jgi:hypothetical protein